MVQDKGWFLRGLVTGLCFFGVLAAGGVFADGVSGRDAKAERELAELYGETVGDWKERESAAPKREKSPAVTRKKAVVETALPAGTDASVKAAQTQPVTPVTPRETARAERQAVSPAVTQKGEGQTAGMQPGEAVTSVAAVPSRLPLASRSAVASTGREKGADGTGKASQIGHVVISPDGRVDDVKTVAALKKAAGKGEASAQFNLGLAYEHGWGVKADLRQAAKWYAKASQQGHAAAQLNLGLMFYQGRGVGQDMKLGVAHFEKSASQGNAIAQFNLGNVYLKGQGVTASETIAAAWFKKSAGQGYVVAQYMLGKLYIDGEGVAQDVPEAVRWYERAASQGLKEAQAAMGLAYEKGYGVRQSHDEALRWYGLAAAQGHQGAAARMNAMRGL